MFPFIKMHRQYTFKSEEQVFDKLNDLTYNKFQKPIDANFVQPDPPAFELSYTGDMEYSSKPLATKLTVIFNRVLNEVELNVTTSTNKSFYVAISFILISLIVSLSREPSFSIVAGHVVALSIFVVWDYVAKLAALRKLEKILS